MQCRSAAAGSGTGPRVDVQSRLVKGVPFSVPGNERQRNGDDETNEHGRTAAHAAGETELGADLSQTDGAGRTLARVPAAFGHADLWRLDVTCLRS